MKQMKRVFFLFSMLVCVSTIARATVFTFSNTTFADGATATGTINIDTVNGFYGNLNLIVNDGPSTYIFNSPATGLGIGIGSGYVFTNYYDGLGNLIDFELATMSLVGYTGGQICTFALCGGSGYLYAPPTLNVFMSGSLVPAVPEPRAFVLLATGLVGLITLRRQLVISQ